MVAKIVNRIVVVDAPVAYYLACIVMSPPHSTNPSGMRQREQGSARITERVVLAEGLGYWRLLIRIRWVSTLTVIELTISRTT